MLISAAWGQDGVFLTARYHPSWTLFFLRVAYHQWYGNFDIIRLGPIGSSKKTLGKLHNVGAAFLNRYQGWAPSQTSPEQVQRSVSSWSSSARGVDVCGMVFTQAVITCDCRREYSRVPCQASPR